MLELKKTHTGNFSPTSITYLLEMGRELGTLFSDKIATATVNELIKI